MLFSSKDGGVIFTFFLNGWKPTFYRSWNQSWSWQKKLGAGQKRTSSATLVLPDTRKKFMVSQKRCNFRTLKSILLCETWKHFEDLFSKKKPQDSFTSIEYSTLIRNTADPTAAPENGELSIINKIIWFIFLRVYIFADFFYNLW